MTAPGPCMNAVTWRESLRLGLCTMLGRAYPRLVSSTRELEWLFYEVALPLLRIMAFLLNVLWTMAAQLHWERLSGNLELYLMALASMLWILAGMAIGGMLAT